MPNLILRSDRSVREVADPERRSSAATRCSTSTQIARWAGCIGNHTTVVPIADAKHDVFLSVPEPRAGGLSRVGPLAGRAHLTEASDDDNSIRTRADHVEHFDIAIIGTGSGNTSPILDERYADKRVAICEQGVFGGTCLNVGCIPTKMFVYAAEVAQSVRGVSRDTGSTRTSTGCAGATSSRGCSAASTRSPMGGENYRRSLAERRRCSRSHTRFGRTQPTAATRCAPRTATEFTADQVVIAAGSRAVVPDGDHRMRRALPHQRHHHAHRRRCPST